MSIDQDRHADNPPSSSADLATVTSNAERSAETPRANSIAISPHMLMNAVADGTITDEAAFCGLRIDDIERLAEKYADAKLLVRLRTALGDARALMSVEDFLRWRDNGDTIIADLRLWSYRDIRDVFPALVDK